MVPLSHTLRRLLLARESLTGGTWVTIDGSHVCIKDGRVVGGAGGKLNGKVLHKSGMSSEEHRAEAAKHLAARPSAKTQAEHNNHNEMVRYHLEQADAKRSIKPATVKPPATTPAKTPAKTGTGVAPTDEQLKAHVLEKSKATPSGLVAVSDIRKHVAEKYGQQHAGPGLDKQLNRIRGNEVSAATASFPDQIPKEHLAGAMHTGAGERFEYMHKKIPLPS